MIMKTNNLRWIAYALSTLMLMQSCKVYHSKPVTVDEAIISSNRIKAKTFVDVTYEFKELIRDNGQLYGLTNRNSSTAKMLFHQIVEEDNSSEKFVKITLLENTIKSYHLQDKTLSVLLGIVFPLALIIVPSVLLSLLLN